MGKGYVLRDMHEGLGDEIGLIALDASFAPYTFCHTVEQVVLGK